MTGIASEKIDDLDWPGAKLKVEHGIVTQHLDTVRARNRVRP